MISVEKIFDRSAATYDNMEEKRFMTTHNLTLEKTLKFLKPEDRVLDFGCATGTKAIELARHVKEIKGIDISSKMIEAAKKKAAEKKIGNINFAKVSLFGKDLNHDPFDVVVGFNILHLLEDPDHVVKRIHELLKSGGLFISVTTCLREHRTVLLRLQFLPFLLISKTGLFPELKRFKYKELMDTIKGGNFKILETEVFFHEMSFLFVAARKTDKKPNN
jgi:2-polyprenyl-3-methyl-5-hydroxy-6-metoxy-1,4-benzoquinol methylase